MSFKITITLTRLTGIGLIIFGVISENDGLVGFGCSLMLGSKTKFFNN